MWILSAIAFVIVVFLTAGYSYVPLSRNEMSRSLALIEDKSYYVITLNGKDVAYFSGLSSDTAFVDFSLCKEASSKTTYSSAFWVNRHSLIPSPDGLLLAAPSLNDSMLNVAGRNLDCILSKEKSTLEKTVHHKTSESSELTYYIKVHGVMDEGFDMISKYAGKVKIEKDSANHLLSEIKKWNHDTPLSVRLVSSFAIYYLNDSSKTQKINCRLLPTKGKNAFRLFQTKDKMTPENVVPLYLHRFLTPRLLKSSTVFAAVYEGFGHSCFLHSHLKSEILSGHLTSHLYNKASHDFPKTMVLDGTPVFSRNGFFVGVAYHGEILNSNQFGSMFKGVE